MLLELNRKKILFPFWQVILNSSPAIDGIAKIIDPTIPSTRSVRLAFVPKNILNRSTKNRTINKTTSPASTPLANGNVCPL